MLFWSLLHAEPSTVMPSSAFSPFETVGLFAVQFWSKRLSVLKSMVKHLSMRVGQELIPHHLLLSIYCASSPLFDFSVWRSVSLFIRKVRYAFFQHFPWQRLMKRNNLDCLQWPYLLQVLCSIPAPANPMIPLKVSCFWYTNRLYCYLFLYPFLSALLPFCLPNIQLIFYLSYTFSLLVPLGVNLHTLKDNTSIPLTFSIWGI